jgi:hypothetical protein
MSATGKVHDIRLAKVQPRDWLAATPEPNLYQSLVTGCCDARRMGYSSATQAKGLSPQIHVVSDADVVHLTECSALITLKQDSSCGWKGLAEEALRHGHILRTKKRVKDGNKTGLITYYLTNDREISSKEPEKPHVRFCEGAHGNPGANTPVGGGL